jgi:hypothetical protein
VANISAVSVAFIAVQATFEKNNPTDKLMISYSSVLNNHWGVSDKVKESYFSLKKLSFESYYMPRFVNLEFLDLIYEFISSVRNINISRNFIRN